MSRYDIHEVQSKMIKLLIWDKKTNQCLVKFKESPIYVYPDVSKDIFNNWLKSKSKGKFFLNVIKKKYSKFTRLDN